MTTLTVAQALAAFSAGTLAAGTVVNDTAINVALNLDALQVIHVSNPSLITSIALANPDRPSLPITLAQQADTVLSLINTPYALAQRVSAAAAQSTSLAAGFLSIAVVDTAANVQANIAGIETLYSRNALGPIFLTDAGIPTISLSAAAVAANIAALARIGVYNLVLTDAGTPTLTLPTWAPFPSALANVVDHITTPFNLAIAGTIRTPNIVNILDDASRADSRSARGSATDPIAPLGVIRTDLLPSGLVVFDSPINMGNYLDALQTAAAAGKLQSVIGYQSGVNVIAMTTATATADALALSKFAPNFQFAQIISASQAASPPALDPRFQSFAVFDTVANLIANAAAVGALYASGQSTLLPIADAAPDFVMTAAQLAQLAPALAYFGDANLTITLTDAGTPTLTLSADVLAMSSVQSNVLVYITTPYHLVVTGMVGASLAASIVSQSTAVRTSLTSITVYDTAANIVANIGALNSLATAGSLTSVILSPQSGIAQLGLSTAQQTTYAAVLAKITGPYLAGTATRTPLSLTAAGFLAAASTIENNALLASQGLIVLTDSNTPTISLSAANFTTWLDAFGLLNSAHYVSLTDTATPNIALAAAQLGIANINELTRIVTPFTFTLAGPISASLAQAIVTLGLLSNLSGTVNILDNSGSLSTIAQINALQAFAAAGKLGTITLSDTSPYGPATIRLDATTAAADAGALAAITSPHQFALIVTAAAAATTTIPQGIFQVLQVQDTQANILANLAALETIAPTGLITAITSTDTNSVTLSAAQVSANYDALNYFNSAAITLSDGGTPTIELQDWQITNSAAPLNRISSPFLLQIDGPIRANVAATLNNAGYAGKFVPGTLYVRDNASGIINRLSQLAALYAAGAISSIEVRGILPIFSLTTSQLRTLNIFAPAITTPYTVSQIITTASLSNPVLSTGFANFTVKDSIANLLANLPALNTLALSGQLNAVQLTDAVPRIVTSASNISTYADFWSVETAGPYPIVLTDAGTPTITVTGGQLSANMLVNVLDAIDGPYHLHLTGNISATVAGTIVEEHDSVLASLTGAFAIADTSIFIAQYYDQLEYLARQGLLTSITLLDPGATINITASQASADTAITPLFTNSYALSLTAACFCPGTMIRTDHGDVAIEDLRETDRLLTATGEYRPIVWIGRRAYDGRFIAENRHILPVHIRAGALAPGIPLRDLHLSPLHALLLDGVLIEARELVNGGTITQASAVDSVTYFNIELDTHDVIFAEGAEAETFVGDESRALFANAHEYRGLFPAAAWQETTYYAPRLDHGEAVHTARNRIARIAGEQQDRLTSPSDPAATGFLDHISETSIQGWAHAPHTSNTRVRVDILFDGICVGTALANRLRPDLHDAGYGDGRHGFEFAVPAGLNPRHAHVEIRAEHAHAPLPASAALYQLAA